MRTRIYAALAVKGLNYPPSKHRPLIHPANTRNWTNVGSMLGRCRRRRASIDTTLVQCFVFVGQCWINDADGGPTLKQHWVNAYCFLGTLSANIGRWIIVEELFLRQPSAGPAFTVYSSLAAGSLFTQFLCRGLSPVSGLYSYYKHILRSDLRDSGHHWTFERYCAL